MRHNPFNRNIRSFGARVLVTLNSVPTTPRTLVSVAQFVVGNAAVVSSTKPAALVDHATMAFVAARAICNEGNGSSPSSTPRECSFTKIA